MNEFSVQDEILFDVHARIVSQGVCVEYVFGERDGPPWAYTVGLLELGHPEVIVFGLEECCAADLMTRLRDEIQAGTVRPVGRNRRQSPIGLGVERSVRLVPVADQYWECADEHRLCIAAAYHAAMERPRAEWKAVQLVVASRSGVFPWHAAASELDRRRQPLLDRGVRSA